MLVPILTLILLILLVILVFKKTSKKRIDYKCFLLTLKTSTRRRDLFLKNHDHSIPLEIIYGKDTRTPENAKKYIFAIEDFIGAKISSISTSPEREDTILVENPFEI